MSSSPASAPPAPARRDGSMSLLVDVMTNTLDEGYAARAAARETGAPPPLRRTVGALLLVLLGVLTGTAAAQVRDRAVAAEGLREELAGEVRQRDAESARLQAEAAALQAEVAAARDRALRDDARSRALADRIRVLELAAGTSAVTGDGVVLVLDDAAPADPLQQDAAAEPGLTGRVLDRDLQQAVNGLWAAGAEAIAVNGVRLSARSAIRSAGEAVLVDFRPLSPPYRIEAVGRPADLEVGFLDGPAGRGLQLLAQATGMTFELTRKDGLELPAAGEPELRAARAADGPS